MTSYEYERNDFISLPEEELISARELSICVKQKIDCYPPIVNVWEDLIEFTFQEKPTLNQQMTLNQIVSNYKPSIYGKWSLSLKNKTTSDHIICWANTWTNESKIREFINFCHKTETEALQFIRELRISVDMFGLDEDWISYAREHLVERN